MRYGRRPKRLHWGDGKSYMGNRRPTQVRSYSANIFQEARRRGDFMRCGKSWDKNQKCKVNVVRLYNENRLLKGVSLIHIISDLINDREDNYDPAMDHHVDNSLDSRLGYRAFFCLIWAEPQVIALPRLLMHRYKPMSFMMISKACI